MQNRRLYHVACRACHTSLRYAKSIAKGQRLAHCRAAVACVSASPGAALLWFAKAGLTRESSISAWSGRSTGRPGRARRKQQHAVSMSDIAEEILEPRSTAAVPACLVSHFPGPSTGLDGRSSRRDTRTRGWGRVAPPYEKSFTQRSITKANSTRAFITMQGTNTLRLPLGRPPRPLAGTGRLRTWTQIRGRSGC